MSSYLGPTNVRGGPGGGGGNKGGGGSGSGSDDGSDDPSRAQLPLIEHLLCASVNHISPPLSSPSMSLFHPSFPSSLNMY